MIRHITLSALLALAGCSNDSGEVDAKPEPGRATAPRTAPVADGPPWFEEVALSAGIDFTHDSGHRDRFLFPECVSGGAALFDMDGDGDLDAYFVQGGALADDPADRPPNSLYRNRGDGTFENVTEGSGADDRGYGIGVATGDYDNDGDLDLYVTNLGPNVLLRNDGDGRFTDVSDEAGIGDPAWGVSAAFVDYDHDGDLDLFITNYVNWSPATERMCTSYGAPDYCEPVGYQAPARDSLYRNDGNGTFTDVSVEAGLATAFGNGMGVVCGDYDGDGLVDVFVANDQMQNQLWRNQGDGTFRNEAMLLGVALDKDGHAKAGMGVASGDVDDDGDLDLLVVNLNGQSDSFYRNEGAFFADDTEVIGLGSVTRPFTRFGLAWVDFDHDGWFDLYEANGRVRRLAERWSDDPYAEPNVLCAGNAQGQFVAVEPRGGTAEPLIAVSRAAAFGDVDNDGDIDILIVNRDGPAHLLRNIAAEGGWIQVRVLDEHGRDAIGAVVTATIDGRRIRRDVRTAYSYCAANDPRVHIGVGDAKTIEDVTVRWVDGAEERFGDLEANQLVELKRGAGG